MKACRRISISKKQAHGAPVHRQFFKRKAAKASTAHLPHHTTQTVDVDDEHAQEVQTKEHQP